MRLLCLLAVLALALCARFRTEDEIVEAFKSDGFAVAKQHTYKGSRGYAAESLTATVLSTGLPKKVYYVEGSAYEMGYLLGLLSEEDASTMCEVYLRHIIPALVSPEWDEKMEASKLWRSLYDKTLDLVMDFFLHKAAQSFARQIDTFPPELVDEMHGLADGAREANPNTKVSYERVVALNYGIDFLLGHVYGASLTETLYQMAVENNTFSAEELSLMSTLTEDYFTAPVFCSGLAVKGNATASGEDVLFARDFQLPTGLVFQNLQYMVIYNPSGCDRLPMVSASAPAFVGAITAVNSEGLAMSVDVLRSGDVNTKAIGLNSCLLVREIASTQTTTNAAIHSVAETQRGVSWLYPLCDASGEGAILEAGPYSTRPEDEETLHYVTSRGLLHLLPNETFVEQFSDPEYYNGIFVRRMDYKQPQEFNQFNAELFKKAKVPYNPAAFEQGGEIFASFQEEFTEQKALMNNYFAPVREEFEDVVACTNNAYVPQMRIAQMSTMGDLLAKSATVSQWRYDKLMKLVAEAHGTFDFDVMKHVITYLSPDREPGFWHDKWNPDDPMSALVEGSITVADLKTGRVATLGGYYTDEWIELVLPKYIDASACLS